MSREQQDLRDFYGTGIHSSMLEGERRCDTCGDIGKNISVCPNCLMIAHCDSESCRERDEWHTNACPILMAITLSRPEGCKYSILDLGTKHELMRGAMVEKKITSDETIDSEKPVAMIFSKAACAAGIAKTPKKKEKTKKIDSKAFGDLPAPETVVSELPAPEEKSKPEPPLLLLLAYELQTYFPELAASRAFSATSVQIHSTKEEKDSIRTLATLTGDAGSFGVVRLNAINVVTPLTGKFLGTGFFKRLSMINHSCNPNCAIEWCEDSLRLFSVREILKGEELTRDYLAPVSSAFFYRCERKKILKERFGFDCECSECMNDEEEDMSPPSTWDDKKMIKIDLLFSSPASTPVEHAENLVQEFFDSREFILERPFVGLRFALPLLDALLAIDPLYICSDKFLKVANDLKRISTEPEFLEMPHFTHSASYKEFGNVHKVVALISFLVSIHYYPTIEFETFKVMCIDLIEAEYDETDVKMCPKIALAQITFANIAKRVQEKHATTNLQAIWRGKVAREAFKKKLINKKN